MRVPVQHPFWDRVKKVLRTRKLSQIQFAASIGVNYSTLKYWICYGYLPELETAFSMADLLDVSIYYLVRGTDEKTVKKPLKQH
ncbi:MAG: helix-turn-helix transcriptional regulator [Treponema sp.]|nr:helix-turn-helix transcriptional regulator [Treponema sp.]